MAEKLEFDTPAAAAAESGRKLEFDAAPGLTREQEIRRENLQKLLAASSGKQTLSGLVTGEQPVSGFSAYTNRLKDAWTSGLSRPMGAAMTTVGGEIGELFGGKPATLGERWRGGIGAEEDYAKALEDRSKGVVGSGVSLLGSLASGGRSVGGAAPGLGVQAVRAGTQGAIEGGARNAEDVGSAATGAVIGGGVNAATSTVLGGLLDRFRRVGAAKQDIGVASRGGTSQTLKEEGGNIYQKLDNAGIKYSSKETTPVAQNMVNTLSKAGYDKAIHKDLNEVVGDIGAMSGKPVTWTQLQNLQSRVSAAKASDDKQVRRMAGEIGNVLDDFVANAKPTIPASSVGKVNPAQDISEARDLWRRGSQAENTEYLAEKGMTTAKDPGRKLETNFGKEIDRVEKPGRYNPNSPEQMELMKSIAQGDPKLSGAASGLNRWGNNLIGYGTAGAAGGAALPFLFNDPSGVGSGTSTGGAAAVAAGLLSKGGGKAIRQMVAERGAERVNDLLRNIVTGSTQQAPGAYVPRNALAVLMAKQDAARAGGNYAASFVDKE
jgi:hypothetical protein